jgi:citrate synthase
VRWLGHGGGQAVGDGEVPRPDQEGFMTESSRLIRGLEGVVAVETELCDLDGANGRLAYRGYDIDHLARHASFEEVCHLLWHGALPTRGQLDRFRAELIGARPIPDTLARAFALLPRETDPMRALQAAVAVLGMHDPDAADSSRAANLRKALRLTSQTATAVAAHHRVRSGLEPVPPSKDLGHAANFLYMLTGREPSAVTVQAFDASLVLYAEHEINASTFTTRVIAATMSDLHSAVAGGVGALKGTLHGGAGEAVMRTLLEIGSLDSVDAFADRAFAEKRRLMGFGHRVYVAGDPRAAILKGMAEAACRQSGQALWYDLAVKLHARVNAAKKLIPNVDFYSAPLFYSIGIPVDLFTPVIAVSRVAGWTANLIEQYEDNRLIRPRADYKGPSSTAFVPLERR